MSGGRVYLVGAGPGDPKLLTLRAVEVLGEADVVLTDHLLAPAVLAHVRKDARVLDVGKRSGERSGVATTEAEIHALIIGYARHGHVVVHLNGGDPFVFGRGGEEAEALVAAEVAWEIVPGVSAGMAAAAYAGIPLTHRDHASRVTFVNGNAKSRVLEQKLDESAQANEETLVVFMCGDTLIETVRELVSRGRNRSTPIALVRAGTWESQEVYVGTLGDVLAMRTIVWRGSAPSLAVIGEVVTLERKLRWFGGVRLPLRMLDGRASESANDRASDPANDRAKRVAIA